METPGKFQGVVHARDFRRPACTAYGAGVEGPVQLRVNLVADRTSDQFCGVFTSKESGERSVAVAVRIHRTLELADDKFYMITCGRAGSYLHCSVLCCSVLCGQDSRTLRTEPAW